MSDTMNSVPPVQAVGASADVLAAVLAASQEAPNSGLTVVPETAPPAPEVTLNAVAAEYRRGVQGHARHHLESGRLASGFIAYRVSVMGHNRASAVKEIVGQLCGIAGRDVDVSALLGTYHAAVLLGGYPPNRTGKDGADTGIPDWSKASYAAVPYSTLEQYARLVERVDQSEVYRVYPSIEAEAVALFGEAGSSAPPMPLRDVGKRVDALVAKAKRVRADALAQQAAAPDAPKAVKAKAGVAKVQAEKAEAKAKAAKAEAPKAPKAALNGPLQPTDCRAPNPLAGLAAANAKDTADAILDILRAHKDPSAVLRLVAQGLKWTPHMAEQLCEGIADSQDGDGALLALATFGAFSAEYGPDAEPSRNGQLAVA